MHRLLKQALTHARGESRHVVTVVADIRGFSQFSQSRDSADVATYISKLYLKLIDLFSGISDEFFFKPTGDGLLMVFPFGEDSLEAMYQEIVARSVGCHDSFEGLLRTERIINFDTPRAIGFGLSRGTACAISAVVDVEKYVLDYSGHKLNLAARLQDLARPSGIVLEGSSDIEMLGAGLRKRFTSKKVYIRSVAETSPVSVWTLDSVQLPISALQPLTTQWMTKKLLYSKRELARLPGRLHYRIKKGTLVPDSVSVKLKRPAHPKTEGRGNRWRELSVPDHFDVQFDAGIPKVVINMLRIRGRYKHFIDEARPRDKLTVEINYQTQ